RSKRDWSSDVCSSDLVCTVLVAEPIASQSTHFMDIKYSVLYFTWKKLPEKSKNASHLCHLKRSDLHMSYAVCRMQKVKSAGLKGMQFHNQRERESRTNEDIDR